MVRYEATIGWYDGDNYTNYKEHTERGIAVGPTPAEALTQIEEYYGSDLVDARIIYDDMMADQCYTEWEEDPWFTKED